MPHSRNSSLISRKMRRNAPTPANPTHSSTRDGHKAGTQRGNVESEDAVAPAVTCNVRASHNLKHHEEAGELLGLKDLLPK